jgi:hypothetical protein
MKAASLSDLKKELTALGKPDLLNLLAHLAKYKKENKELLSYLMFDAHNEPDFIQGLKDEMDELFSTINKSNTYLAKKGFRKILRLIQKNIKFSGFKQTEIELLLYYCLKMKDSGIDLKRTKVLMNMYDRLLEKIDKILLTFHEDLQADYTEIRSNLSLEK